MRRVPDEPPPGALSQARASALQGWGQLPGGTPRPRRGQGLCYRCNQPGHYVAECLPPPPLVNVLHPSATPQNLPSTAVLLLLQIRIPRATAVLGSRSRSMAVVVVNIPRLKLPRLQALRLLLRTWGTTAAMLLRSNLVYSPCRLRHKADLFVKIFWS